MIKVLEGNDFLIKEYIQDFINEKFKGLDELTLKFSILKNPEAVSVITENSAFALNGRVIIWDFEVFKKFEKFDPYLIPQGVDIFIIGTKIDKRLSIIKGLEAFNATFLEKEFKDLYPNQVENWILLRKKKISLNMDAESVKLLALLYGTKLAELSNQLNELKKLNVPITKVIVLQTSTAVNSFSIFELQDLVTCGNSSKAVYVFRQMMKEKGNGFETLRYFVNFFEKLIIIKLNDSGLITKLGLHPFILKKLRDVRISVNGSQKALDILKKAELKILKGLDSIYVTERTIYELSKIV